MFKHVRGIYVLLIIAFLFSFSVMAYPTFPAFVDTSVKNLYGAQASYNYSCTLCHGNQAPPALPQAYGVEIKEAWKTLYPAKAIFELTQPDVQVLVQTVNADEKDHDGDGVSSRIEFINATNPSDPNSKPVICTRANPTIAIDPAKQTATQVSQKLSYNVSIKNNDSVDCQASTFLVGEVSQETLAINLPMQSIALLPGQTRSLVIDATAAANLANGSYTFMINTSNAALPDFKGSVAGEYVLMIAAACVPQKPTLTLDPISQKAKAGDTANYTLTIKNNDSAECQASQFDFSFNSVGLTGELSLASVNLNPGQTQDIVASVKSALNAGAGTYNFSLSSSDAKEALHAAQTDGQYVIDPPLPPPPAPKDEMAPSVPTQVTSFQRGKRWLVINWLPSTDNVGVTGYQLIVNDEIVGETTRNQGRVKIINGEIPIVYVRALDAAGNMSGLSEAAAFQPKSKGRK